jgi:hypothetical protein
MLLLCGGAALHAHPPAQGGVDRLLDVPYVAQTPELCGGAAVAMVLRYWGERDVFAQDFQSLVVESAAGIPTGALAAAVRDRRWQAWEIPPGTGVARTRIRAEVEQGRPLIALIEVAAGVYHYVVIVGATELEVVVHDPARAPFLVAGWEAFDRAWASAGRWLLLVLPPDGVRPRAPAGEVEPVEVAASPLSATPCDGLIERGVSLAVDGDRPGAEQALSAATRMCPAKPASWRELAGLRFAQSRWVDAGALAATALRLSPDDDYTRRLLATSRYLAGNETGALAAWSPLGEPRVDAIDVHGAERTRHPVVVDAIGLKPRQLLTAEAFGRASRRLGQMPVVSSARLRYEPLDGGLARLDAIIVERPVVPRGWVPLGSLAGRAAISQELRAEFAGALGAGEAFAGAWRWTAARPRVALDLATPAPGRLPGVVSVSALWERQAYSVGSESRRRSRLSLSEWGTSWFFWDVGVALDRFAGRDSIAADVGFDVRLAGDHLSVQPSAEGWTPRGEGERFGRVGVRVAWRSDTGRGQVGWSGALSVTAASQAAPLALWEGAGTGNARSGLLRAHRLLNDDVLTSDVFGRELTNGTLEYAHPLARVLTADLALAGFVDGAKARRGLSPAGPPLYIDAGIGLRLSAAGRPEVLRIDLAHGLRGGGARASISWARGWPR